MNPIDRAIAAVAPRWGLQRARDRARLRSIETYEAAARGRRGGGWAATSADASSVGRGALHALRARSRYLRRNNPFMARAIAGISNNAIGYGIQPSPQGRTKTLTKRAQDEWRRWAGSTVCDVEGRLDLNSIILLAMETIVESGEVLLRRYPVRGEGSSLPLQIQILEPDHLDSEKDGAAADASDSRRFVQGVELDERGRRINYWLHKEHPGWNGTWQEIGSKPVPAEDIAHGYRVDRPGQVRGIPWSAPVILRLKNFDDTEDAYLERQKIAACFSVFLYDDDPMPLEGAAQSELVERVEPGLIQRLPPGLRAEFGSPGAVDGYRDFAWINLHAIASGMQVPYELLTGDLAGVNFSSGRMGWLEFQRSLERWRWQMVIPQLMDQIWRWFVEAGVVAGFWAEDIPVEWTAPRREMIDPAKETLGIKERVRSGLQSWQEAVREQGYDPEQVLKELAEDNQRFDQLGLSLDIDARQQPGQQRNTTQEEEPDAEDG